MKETTKDNRTYPRISSRFTVTATKLEYPFVDTLGVLATSMDIAEGGISFFASQDYPPNALLSLKIDIKGWRRFARSVRSIVDAATTTAPLTAVVQVVWSRAALAGEGYEIGAKFINIDQDDYRAFQKYLEHIRSSEDKEN